MPSSTSMTEGIPRAPDLPFEEHADTYRTARPRRQRAARPRPADSSSEEEEDLDDPAPADDSPPEPDAPAAPDVAAAAAGAPADPPVPDPPGDMPAPARGPPSRRVVDPSCRLRPGNHTLVCLKGTARQKRCRVCHVSGRRKDTQFMCSTCKMPLCRISDCSRRYHTMAMYWSTPPRGTVPAAALVTSSRASVFLLHLNLVMSRGIKCKTLQWRREKTRLKSQAIGKCSFHV